MSALTVAIDRARAVNPDFIVKTADGAVGVGDEFAKQFKDLNDEEKLQFWQMAMRHKEGDDTEMKGWGGWNPIGDRNQVLRATRALDATPEGKAYLQGAGADYLRGGGMKSMFKSWGDTTGGGDGSFGSAIGNNLGTYLPLGGGLLAALGGALSGNKMIALLGMLAAAYGGYKMYSHANTLKDPKLWAAANAKVEYDASKYNKPGMEAEAAKAKAQYDKDIGPKTEAQQQLQEAYGATAPFLGARSAPTQAPPPPTQAAPLPTPAPAQPQGPVVAKNTPLHQQPPQQFAAPAPAPQPFTAQPQPPVVAKQAPPQQQAPAPAQPPKLEQPQQVKAAAWTSEMPDRSDLASSLRGHIDLDQMKRAIERDRNLDPISAGRLLASIELAERSIDRQPSVAAFGLAAGPALGLAAAVALGSLFATSPATQGQLQQTGGVISGAQRLGAI